MKCKYCEQENGHLKGCPETVPEMSKTQAIRDFDAGSFSAAAYYAESKDRSDSYQLGYKMGSKGLANDPLNC